MRFEGSFFFTVDSWGIEFVLSGSIGPNLIYQPPASDSVHFFQAKRTLLGTKGIATRSKDATRGSWPYY